MEAWTDVITWAAGMGAVAGLGYAFWAPRDPPHVDLAIFLILGVLFMAWFLYAVYIGDPETRGVRKIAFMGPFLLASGVVIGIVRVALGKRGPRRRKPGRV